MMSGEERSRAHPDGVTATAEIEQLPTHIKSSAQAESKSATKHKDIKEREINTMPNTKIHFEVAITGLVNCFNNFNDARDEYHELRACGFRDVTLRRVEETNGDRYVVAWNDKCACFFPC